MKRLFVAVIGATCALLFASCETNLKSAPPVTAAFVRASGQEMTHARMLEAGRKVFLNRCIACHALPDVTLQDSPRIPGIVNLMATRANLTAEQHEALVKYLLAVKSQSR